MPKEYMSYDVSRELVPRFAGTRPLVPVISLVDSVHGQIMSLKSTRRRCRDDNCMVEVTALAPRHCMSPMH